MKRDWEYETYAADDAEFYVLAGDPPEIGDLDEGWACLMQDLEDRSAALRYESGCPEQHRTDQTSTDNLAEYVDQHFDVADITRMTRAHATQERVYWDLHVRHPHMENGTYLVRFAGFDDAELDAHIGF